MRAEQAAHRTFDRRRDDRASGRPIGDAAKALCELFYGDDRGFIRAKCHISALALLNKRRMPTVLLVIPVTRACARTPICDARVGKCRWLPTKLAPLPAQANMLLSLGGHRRFHAAPCPTRSLAAANPRDAEPEPGGAEKREAGRLGSKRNKSLEIVSKAG